MIDPIVAKLRRIQADEQVTDVAFARKLGLSVSMWHRVRSGERNAGRKVIHGALRTYPELAYLLVQSLTIRHDDVADTKVAVA